MPTFADIHCHILSHTDDGAENDEVMARMLEMQYDDGVRVLCATPHYNTKVWPDVPERADAAYLRLSRLAAERYPFLTLCRGNELYYQHDAPADIAAGRCHTLNGGRWVLVDFASGEDFFLILHGLGRIASAGYRPILAHAERYECLHRNKEGVERLLRDTPAVFQINASSLFGAWGAAAERQAKRLLRHGQAYLIASDAHDAADRPPGMSRAAAWIAGKMGEAAAETLCLRRPLYVLGIERP